MLMEAERNVQKQSENKWKKEAHTVDNISRKRHRSCSRSPQRRDSGRTAVRASAYQDSDRYISSYSKPCYGHPLGQVAAHRRFICIQNVTLGRIQVASEGRLVAHKGGCP